MTTSIRGPPCSAARGWNSDRTPGEPFRLRVAARSVLLLGFASGAGNSAYFGVTYGFGGRIGLGAALNRSVNTAPQDPCATSLDLSARSCF